MEIPAKLIRLTRMTIKDSTAKVKTNEGDTNDIKIELEVRQGDSLSTTNDTI